LKGFKILKKKKKKKNGFFPHLCSSSSVVVVVPDKRDLRETLADLRRSLLALIGVTNDEFHETDDVLSAC
jgi:hypothetical protein